jgi:subtilase family serine protease
MPSIVARRCGAAILIVACLTLGAAAGNASALSLPGLSLPGLPAVAPLHGALIDLPCANPANHGLVGRVLAAVQPRAGGALRCFATAIGYADGAGPLITSGPTGYGPTQIQSAYKLEGASGTGTVAVVDAYNDPDAATNLATYRSSYGLPACTTANGCFKQVNESGATAPLPSGDYGWAEEESLDLDTISATCPACHILLVEASSAETADLDKAEDTAAAAKGVVAISNSYGGTEDSSELADDANFNHPGIAITAAAGDSGYGIEWPAASPDVTAVGGTTLDTASNSRGWTETVWADTGSGCSAYEKKPSWQQDTGCKYRTDNDVAADANPTTGLAVYDTYNQCGSSSLCDLLIELGIDQGLDGWTQVGGTSLASPLIASVYALAGNTHSIVSGSYPYSHVGSLYPVTSGSNGSCSPAYLCTAGPGYSGPAGLGTPDGVTGF